MIKKKKKSDFEKWFQNYFKRHPSSTSGFDKGCEEH